MLFVFAPAPPRPAPPRAAPATREMEFHERARGLTTMGYRITVATTTLSLLTKHGAGKAMWRVVGRGEDRLALGRPPKAR
ncbi:hypothetical protein ACWEQ7_21550 [Streptomyces sp. NPDC004069]